MGENENQQKRNTTAFDPRVRKKHVILLIFAGLETISAGSISVAAIQKKLFENFPDLLNRFPEYHSYFAISTWLAFFAGLFFLLFPMSCSLWIGHYLVGMSLAYIVLGTEGVAGIFPVAFYFVYCMAILLPIVARINTIGFYKKHTRFDLLIYIIMSLSLVGWGAYEIYSF